MISVRDLLKRYWQIPAALVVSGMAVVLSTPTVIETPILPPPEPELVEAWVLMTPARAGDVLAPEMVQTQFYPIAWMPPDAVPVTETIWRDHPLIRQDLPLGTPLARHMLASNPKAQLAGQLKFSDLLLRMPTELAQSLPHELPPQAHATLLFESQVGRQGGVLLSAIPMSVTDPESLQRTLWLHLSTEQLSVFERGRRLGRLHIGLCEREHCPPVSLKRLEDPSQQSVETAPKRAKVTVGVS